jgi:adenylosuccinate synthase
MTGNADAVIGAQWGDEGKGKITHSEAAQDQYSVVARATGGANAGHTLVIDGESFALHQLPTGIVYPEKDNVMGRGMVIETQGLVGEMNDVENKFGVEIGDRLHIDNRATILTLGHKALDSALEKGRGNARIGTTKKGIGPAYVDRVARVALLAHEMKDPAGFTEKAMAHISSVREQLLAEGFDPEEEGMENLRDIMDLEKVERKHLKAAQRLGKLVTNTVAILERNGLVLIEGAQGVLLSYLHGTYPHVTSSSPGIDGTIGGLGINHRSIRHVTGVAKTYTTRVGAGPFPSELAKGEKREITHLRGKKGTAGAEFGATTGRPRRIGWEDTVAIRQSIRHGGIDRIALTKLDVLSGLDRIKVCVGYRHGGQVYRDFEDVTGFYGECEPVYAEMPGWKEDLTNVRSFSDLPKNARDYVDFLETQVGVPISIVSVGAGDKDVIDRRKVA